MEYHGQVGSDWVSVLRARALHKKQEQCVPIIQPSSLLATPNTSLQQWLDITARHNVSNLMKGGDISTNIPLGMFLLNIYHFSFTRVINYRLNFFSPFK